MLRTRGKPFYDFTFERYDENEEDNSSRDANEKKYEEQFLNLLKEHPELNKVDYIAINTGYTSRIISSKKHIAVVRPIVVFPESDGYFPYISPDGDDAFKTFTNLFCGKPYLMSIFRGPAKKTLPTVARLGKTRFCAFCSIDNICRIRWYKIDDKVVLTCDVDCESG